MISVPTLPRPYAPLLALALFTTGASNASALTPKSSESEPRGSLLATVPADTFALVHLADPAGLRNRAEQNEWIEAWTRLERESIWSGLEREISSFARVDFEGMFELVPMIDGPSLLFFGGSTAGFLTEPPTDRTALANELLSWLAESPRHTLELGDARVVVSTWPTPEGVTRAYDKKTFLAFVDHPDVLGLVSGDSKDAVDAAIADVIGALGSERRAPVVEGFLAAGGGTTRGLEAYIDFTPFIAQAEAVLRDATAGILPDPTGLLGLEKGTNLFLTADASPGKRLQVDAHLAIPKDTLAAKLADTFETLPATYPAELPLGTWTCFALDWNVARFIDLARKSLEKVDENGLAVVDSGLETTKAMTGVDPMEDVIGQLTGLFSWYLRTNPLGEPTTDASYFGFLLGIADGDAFYDVFEAVIEGFMVPAQNIELEGAETFVFSDVSPDVDGGMAILAQRALIALSRDGLERGVRALNGADGAGLGSSSRLAGAFDENPGAFAFAYTSFLPFYELTLRRAEAYGDEPEADPLAKIDGDFVLTARRTAEGVHARYYTR